MPQPRILPFLVALCITVLALSAAFSPKTAGAQWLPDRAYTEGPGIRVGDLELHPGVAFRGGYDTNVFRTRTNEIGSGILALTPHLNIQTLSRQRMTQGEEAAGAQAGPLLPKIAFNAGLAGTLFYYLDDRAPRNVEFDTEAGLSVLPERPLGFDVGVAFARTTRPFTVYTGSDANNFYANDRLTPRLALRGQSRSGVLKGSIAYAPTVDLYEADPFKYLNKLNHEVTARGSWKFLPFTALVYEGTIGATRYNDLTDNFAVVRISDSNRLQTRIGLQSALTPRFGIRALVGYAAGFYKDPLLNDYENGIGEAAVSYKFDVHSIELGYLRNVSPSSLGGWMQDDRGFLTASTLLGRVFAVTLRGGAGTAHYGRILDVNGGTLGIDRATGLATTKREDVRIDGGLHLEYRATNWLAIMADGSVIATLTDFQYTTARSVPITGQFVSYQAFGGIRFHY
jgi:hypothetical protein